MKELVEFMAKAVVNDPDWLLCAGGVKRDDL
jgi:predicted RNA-binding protein YlqC (UPF0109 family)